MTVSYSSALQAKLLDLSDERDLIERWQNARDSDALGRLVLSHARLAFQIANRLSKDKSEQEELVSEGLLALVHAADLFDLSRETRFSTYARWWVKNRALKSLSRMRAVVDVPRHQKDEEPWTAVQTLDDVDIQNTKSDTLDPEQELIRKTTLSALQEDVANAIARLEPIDREVVLSRSLKTPPEDLRLLAERLGFTVEKLRQLERRAMLRLKHGLISNGFSPRQVD